MFISFEIMCLFPGSCLKSFGCLKNSRVNRSLYFGGVCSMFIGFWLLQ